MITDVAFVSEKGLVREKNQDAVFVDSDGMTGLFIVADGMGGHSQGEVASGKVITEMAAWWGGLEKDLQKYDIKELADRFHKVLMQSNQDIYIDFSLRNLFGGTTVAALLVWGKDCMVASIGDSHIYRREGRHMKPLTVDDVWENLPEIRFVLPMEEINKSPRLGCLTAAAGVEMQPSFQIDFLKVDKEDLFLLCSDGIYKYCDEEALAREICGMAGRRSTGKMLDAIKRKVIANGAGDNYSAVICKIRRR